MTFRTPALSRAMTALLHEFPGIRFGIYNRRPIAGTTRWSQHSWPNALDIFFTHYGDTSPAHQAQLDKVHVYLQRNYVTLDIKFMAWRKISHEDHIHIDFWPTGYGTPSVTRGGSDNRYLTQGGRVITQAELMGEEEDEMKQGDRGAGVKQVQGELLNLGFDLGNAGADGIYGPATAAAVAAYQATKDLPETGNANGVTLAFLLQGIPGPQGMRGPKGKDGEVPDLSKFKLVPVE